TVVGTVMRPDDIRWLAASPILGTVETLNLLDSNLRQVPTAMVGSLANIKTLRIPSNHLNDRAVIDLFALPKLPELDLSITSSPQRDHGSGREPTQGSIAGARAIETLASWKGLAGVQALDVSGWELGRAGLTMLLSSPHTKGIKALRIRDIADAE